jgi:hypothetical protein
VRLLLAQGVQPAHLPRAEAAGDALDDLAVGRRDHLGGQPLQDRDAGDDDPTPSHLLGKGGHDRDAVGRDQGDAEQPILQRLAVWVGQVDEAVGPPQDPKLLVAGGSPPGKAGERFGQDVELRGDEAGDLHRDRLAGAKQPAGVAQGAELQRQAEPRVRPPATGDQPAILVGRGVIPPSL